MSKKVAILQSNYIPWKGYFDMINMVDSFVILDEVQFTKNDWRNRNQIKTPNGMLWLTIPVVQKKLGQSIMDTKIADPRWSVKHWKSIVQNYGKAPFFLSYKDELETLYASLRDKKYLSEVNLTLIMFICNKLGITTEILNSSDINKSEDKNQRLIDMCRHLNASAYISGSAAQGYLDESLFKSEGISVQWMDYSGYPEYDQLFSQFSHSVTILDMLFNLGNKAPDFMKSFDRQ